MGAAGAPDAPPSAPAALDDWRPAVFSHRRHRVAAAPADPVIAFHGDALVATRCGGTAFYDAATRGGPPRWGRWPVRSHCLAAAWACERWPSTPHTVLPTNES